MIKSFCRSIRKPSDLAPTATSTRDRFVVVIVPGRAEGMHMNVPKGSTATIPERSAPNGWDHLDLQRRYQPQWLLWKSLP